MKVPDRGRAVRSVRLAGLASAVLLGSLVLVAQTCTAEPASHQTQERSDEPRWETEPIVLVHGFGGWGRNEIPGFFYWGGAGDLQESLRAAGHTVGTAVVGPISSNWDRACELFAFIQGGTVDYGEHHSRKHGHERYGATYAGAFPDWSDERRIHLIGHSMGGQTARLLAHLLRHGDENERAASGENTSALFLGGEQRIRSITTLSTPHNGTTLVNDVDLVERLLRTALGAAAVSIGTELFPHFDLKMTQWGIERRPDESLAHYYRRISNHPVWSATHPDSSLWDLSPGGAAELNELAPAEPDVYYFSWANDATMPAPFTSHRIPVVTMLPAFVPSALFIGAFTMNGDYDIGSRWWNNDGVVNSISMRGPFLGSSDTIVDYDGNPVPGRWNYMGLLESTDHADIIGIPDTEAVVERYRSIASLVSSLDAEPTPRR